MATAFVPLANITLGGNQNTVTFSSISSAYKDLRIVMTPKTTASYQNFFVRFNSDGSASYERIWTQTNGSSLSGTYEQSRPFMQMGGSLAWNSTSGASNVILDIMSYSETNKQKSMLERSNIPDSPAFAGSVMAYHRWNNTAAVTSIQISWNAGTNFVAGSTFALYGMVG